jgi:quercetin dioxygenase-like cupin family protein
MSEADQLMCNNKLVHRFNDFTWEGIEIKGYKKSTEGKTTSFACVEKQVICPSDSDIDFEVRYFEIGKGGYTTLEKHEHVHFVVIVRGKGKIIIGEQVFEAHPFDAFKVPSWDAHQLINTDATPFGFFCSVNAQRDKYRLLSVEELRTLLSVGLVKDVAKVPKGYPEIFE